MSIATPSPSVVPAVPEEQTRATAALVAAFVQDPLLRWMFPDPEQYLTFFPQVLRFFGGGAFELGSAYRTDDFAATALWLEPGVSPDEEALGGVMEEGVDTDRLGSVLGLIEKVGEVHPEVDHWYLPVIGVDPSRQGAGYGSLLLGHTLAAIDAHGVPAYLESSNEKNLPLYERFGFQVIAEIQAVDSPTIWPMLRPAQPTD